MRCCCCIDMSHLRLIALLTFICNLNILKFTLNVHTSRESSSQLWVSVVEGDSCWHFSSHKGLSFPLPERPRVSLFMKRESRTIIPTTTRLQNACGEHCVSKGSECVNVSWERCQGWEQLRFQGPWGGVCGKKVRAGTAAGLGAGNAVFGSTWTSSASRAAGRLEDISLQICLC